MIESPPLLLGAVHVTVAVVELTVMLAVPIVGAPGVVTVRSRIATVDKELKDADQLPSVLEYVIDDGYPLG